MKQIFILTIIFILSLSGNSFCLPGKQFEKSTAVNSGNKGDVNLALGRKCKVFSFADSSDLSFSKLTDGHTETMAWSSRSFASVADHTLFPEYVVIDLGKTCVINRIVLFPRGDNSMAGKGFPEDFTVQICREGKPWNILINKKGYNEPKDGNGEFFELAGIIGRYIKVEATRLRLTAPGKYMFQLSEIEVFGHEIILKSEISKAIIGKSNTAVTRLRCENRDNPAGIDVEQPRLSWWLENNSERGLKQTAYRILVASSKEILAQDKGDLWDSGKKMSDQSIAIFYNGIPAKTGQVCFWKVMVWYISQNSKQKELQTQWSSMASWTNGKIRPEDWKGHWIGATDDTKHGAVYLRKEIDVTKPVKRAMVYFSGLGFSELYINGNKVGNYLVGPGFTNYNRRIQYLTFDVSDHFTEVGKNALGVILVDGWYGLEKDPWVHKFETNIYVDKPKLLLNLHLEYEDGTESVITSDLNWKWSAGEITKSGIAYEDIDLRRTLAGWDKTGYNDSKWHSVKEVKGPDGKLVNQKESMNFVVKTIKPAGMEYDPVSKTCIYELGQEVCGLIQFKTSGISGTEINITPVPTEARFLHTSKFILAGNAKEELYSSRFFYHAMRSVKIEGITKPPSIEDLKVSVISSIDKFPVTFRCSDDFVNWINESVKRTVSAYNTFLPNDPSREFKAWMQDPQNMFVSSVYLFDAQNMYERWQWDIIDGQREDGNSPNVTPGAFFDAYNSPWWGGCLVWLPWHWYQYYGDTSLLKASYPSMKRYVDYLKKVSVNGVQDWGLLDWQPVEETPRPVINTPAYYFYADIVAKTALLMDNNENFIHYSQLAENIRDNFNKRFLDKASGIYGDIPGMFSNGFYEWKPRINEFKGKKAEHDFWWNGSRVCTQAGQILPLALGMVPEDSRSVVRESLLREIKAHHNRLSTGFVSTPYLLQIIGDLNPETGWEMTTAQDYPSWYSMTAGSDNDLMKEDWAGGTAFMPSLGGNITGWFYQFLAGILPDSSAPGFKKIIIKPNIVGDLHWVEGSYESVYGKIISNWKKKDNKIVMDITIPPNTTATVFIPIFNGNIPDRKAILESGKPAEESTGIRYLRTDKNFIIYEVGSGNYIFSSESK